MSSSCCRCEWEEERKKKEKRHSRWTLERNHKTRVHERGFKSSLPFSLSLSRYFFNNGLKHHLSTTRLFFGYQNLVAHNGIPIKLVPSFTCKGRKQMQGVKRTVREHSGKGEKNREREEGMKRGKRQDTEFR